MSPRLFRWRICFLILVLQFLLLHPATRAQDSLEVTPAPLAMVMDIGQALGPDGPWIPVTLQPGTPEQPVLVYPGRGESSILTLDSACAMPGANCSINATDLFHFDAGRIPEPDSLTQYFDILDNPPGWNSNVTAALHASGRVRHMLDTISRIDMNGMTIHMENQSILLSDGLKSSYVDGTNITMAAGVMSLANSSFNNPLNNANHSIMGYSPLAWLSSVDPAAHSPSFGLYIGSAMHNSSATFRLGSYEQEFVLTEPGIFNETAFPLTNLSINSTIADVASSGNLLDPAELGTGGIRTILEPSIPYLYLPPEVCSSLASKLDLTYLPNLELYSWNFSNPSTTTLVNSLSHISFTFTNASNVSTAIDIPFALLNLTLEPPLTSHPIPYFPCRPYEPPPGQNQYFLGRAFLQGAFLGQNWATGKHWLAQAPGPNRETYNSSKRGLLIQPGDETIAPLPNAPRWQDTWKGTLTQNGKPAATLSKAAKVGIAVGATVGGILLISVVVFGTWLAIHRRRRHRQDEQRAIAALKDSKELPTETNPSEKMSSESKSEVSDTSKGSSMVPKPELRGDHWKVEMEANSTRQIGGVFELMTAAGTPPPVSEQNLIINGNGSSSSSHNLEHLDGEQREGAPNSQKEEIKEKGKQDMTHEGCENSVEEEAISPLTRSNTLGIGTAR